METNKEYLARLLPLLKKEIPSQWRVQSFSKQKAVATVMSYIDQRDLMDVLDKYCEYGWDKRYEEVAGNLFCYIGVRMPDGSLMWRADCGIESQSDAEKGRASDAAKRAGVNWGVGRFLYDMPVEYVTASEIKTKDNWPFCVDEQGKRIWDLDKYINDRRAKGGKFVEPINSQTTTPPAPPKEDNLTPEMMKVIEEIGKVAPVEKDILEYASGLSAEMKANEKIKALLNKRVVEARKLVKA